MENQFDRRNFMKTTILGASALAFPYRSFPLQEEKKLGVALVGLGNYATNRLAPAFEHTKHCRLAGIVTGTPAKEKKWMNQYGIPASNIYNYDTFDKISENDDIDIVYVVLPNAMHSEFVIRAARAGKHVICEKPFDTSVKKAAAAVEACQKAGVLLQIGYRCQYDPYHQEFMRIGKEKDLGNLTLIRANFSFFGVHGTNWRFTDPMLAGGGALMDIGVYCIQGARYACGMEPIEVSANQFNTFKNKMAGMEESILFTLKFPGGLSASLSSSYAARANFIEVSAEKVNYGLQPAFGYSPVQGFKGEQKIDLPHYYQQATQMDAFAQNIKDGTPVIADGEEGLRDMKIIEAIYQSARKNGKSIKI